MNSREERQHAFGGPIGPVPGSPRSEACRTCYNWYVNYNTGLDGQSRQCRTFITASSGWRIENVAGSMKRRHKSICGDDKRDARIRKQALAPRSTDAKSMCGASKSRLWQMRGPEGVLAARPGAGGSQASGKGPRKGGARAVAARAAQPGACSGGCAPHTGGGARAAQARAHSGGSSGAGEARAARAGAIGGRSASTRSSTRAAR